MKNYIRVFISSVMAGIVIAVGVIVYLSACAINEKTIGSILFGLGLFTIVHFKLHLYTGRVGNLLNEKPDYILKLLICLIGNFVGIAFLTLLLKLTRVYDTVYPYALMIAQTKENDSWYSIFILSILCGVMIYIACKGHERCEYSLGKLVFVFVAISIFIMAGFEHCIANAAYFILANIFTWKTLFLFILMILGNAIGAIAFDFAFSYLTKLKKETNKE